MDLAKQPEKFARFLFRQPGSRFFANVGHAFRHLIPNWYNFFCHLNPVFPAVLSTLGSRDPAAVLHSTENAGQSRRLNHQAAGEFRLRQLFLSREPSDHLHLPKRNIERRQLLGQTSMKRVCRYRQPKANAILKVIFFHPTPLGPIH